MLARSQNTLLVGLFVLGAAFALGCDGTDAGDDDGASYRPPVDTAPVDGDSDAGPESTPGDDTPGAAPTGVDLPDGWPSDVAIAEYMSCESVTRVRDDFMVTFHARDKSVADVVGWFRSTMGENAWSIESEVDQPTRAILPFTKADRKCGISITNFVLTPSMQRDESSCTVTIQTPAQAD